MIRIIRNSWLVLLGIVIGFALGYWFMKRRERALQLSVPTPPVPVSLTPPTPPLPEPPDSSPDDLTEVEGIGPAYAQALNELGVTTFAQLADSDPDDLAARIDRLSAARIRRDEWIAQAETLRRT